MNTQQALLNIASRNKEAFLTVVSEFEDTDFTGDSRYIYTALKSLYDNDIEPDLVFITGILRDKGLKKLADEFRAGFHEGPAVWTFPALIKKFRSEKRKRIIHETAIQLAGGIREKRFSDDQIEQILRDLMNGSDNSVEACKIADMARDDLDNIFTSSRYYKTGITELDDILHGLFDGQLVIIAARPGQGKTSLAMQIADKMDRPVLFSCEMGRKEIFARLLSSRAGVDSWKIPAKKLEPAEVERVISAKNYYMNNSTMLVYDNVYDINRILTIAGRLCEQDKAQSVYIDYLQLLSGGKGDNQNGKISDITRKCKLFSLEYQVPVILLSQLSRDSAKNKRRPALFDLRDSGSIEQDADRVIFIHEEDDQYEFIIAKNRNGKIDSVKTSFNKARFKFGIQTDIQWANPGYFQD
jgi:replicative DNA helicase